MPSHTLRRDRRIRGHNRLPIEKKIPTPLRGGVYFYTKFEKKPSDLHRQLGAIKWIVTKNFLFHI